MLQCLVQLSVIAHQSFSLRMINALIGICKLQLGRNDSQHW